MRAFRFRLERVLHWRRTEQELEEYKLRTLSAEMDQIERSRALLVVERTTAERAVLQARSIGGAELAAHAAYLEGLAGRERQLQMRRQEQERRIAERHKRLVEARRRVRVLERLRARGLAEWQAASNREIEDFAAEAHLARWSAGGRVS